MADRRMRKKLQIFHAIMVVTRAEEWGCSCNPDRVIGPHREKP